jgi:hypothetical protein
MNLKRYLNAGGDWTHIVELPSHLRIQIAKARLPPQTTTDLAFEEVQRAQRERESARMFGSLMSYF